MIDWIERADKEPTERCDYLTCWVDELGIEYYGIYNYTPCRGLFSCEFRKKHITHWAEINSPAN